MDDHVGKGKNKRPVLKVQWTELHIIMIVFGIIGIAVMSGAVLLYWPELPARIPTHFGFSGEADAWGDKAALIYVTLVAAGLFVMMLVLSRFPHGFNYPVAITEENAEVQYRMATNLILGMGTGTVWLFVYICLQMIRTALGQVQGLGSIFLIVVLVLSLGGLIGYVILAVRRAH